MALKLRTLTDDERTTIDRPLYLARTAPARQVERAQILWHLQQGLSVPTVAERLHRMNRPPVTGSIASIRTACRVWRICRALASRRPTRPKNGPK